MTYVSSSRGRSFETKDEIKIISSWMDLKGIILYDFSYMQNLLNKQTKLIDTENRAMVARGRGGVK